MLGQSHVVVLPHSSHVSARDLQPETIDELVCVLYFCHCPGVIHVESLPLKHLPFGSAMSCPWGRYLVQKEIVMPKHQ